MKDEVIRKRWKTESLIEVMQDVTEAWWAMHDLMRCAVTYLW